MYNTEESDIDTMDPNLRFGTMNFDKHELEDYDLTQLQPQNLNQDSPYPTYQPVDDSDTESNRGP